MDTRDDEWIGLGDDGVAGEVRLRGGAPVEVRLGDGPRPTSYRLRTAIEAATGRWVREVSYDAWRRVGGKVVAAELALDRTQPTHRLDFTPDGAPTETSYLYAPGDQGGAYTHDEWLSDAQAAWTVRADGWFHGGCYTPQGRPGVVVVTPVAAAR